MDKMTQLVISVLVGRIWNPIERWSVKLSTGYYQPLPTSVATSLGSTEQHRDMLVTQTWLIYDMTTKVVVKWRFIYVNVRYNTLTFDPFCIFQSLIDSWWSLVIPFAAIILVLFIIDYYVESVSVNRLETFKTARYSAYALCTSALILSYLWYSPPRNGSSGEIGVSRNMEHAVSGGVIFSTLLFMLGKYTVEYHPCKQMPHMHVFHLVNTLQM